MVPVKMVSIVQKGQESVDGILDFLRLLKKCLSDQLSYVVGPDKVHTDVDPGDLRKVLTLPTSDQPMYMKEKYTDCTILPQHTSAKKSLLNIPFVLFFFCSLNKTTLSANAVCKHIRYK